MKRSLEALRSDEAIKVEKVTAAVRRGTTETSKAVVASGNGKKAVQPAG